jgi:hypothetical protein
LPSERKALETIVERTARAASEGREEKVTEAWFALGSFTQEFECTSCGQQHSVGIELA